MKCPKCHYLGFETGDRCKNCGYDFSLIELSPRDEVDLTIRMADESENPAWFDQVDRGLVDDSLIEPSMEEPSFTEPGTTLGDPAFTDTEIAETGAPGSVVPPAPAPAPAPAVPIRAEPALPLFAPAGADDEPLIRFPKAPRPPLAVRRTPDTSRLRAVSRPRSSPEPVLQFAEDPEPPMSRAPDPADAAVRVPARDERISGETSTPGPRLTAAAVDHALLGAIDVAVVYFTVKMAGLALVDWQALPPAPLVAFLLLLKLAYFSAFTAAGGQTIGKMATGLRVITDGGVAVDGACAVRRTLAAGLSALVLGLGFVPALVGGERRALHDLIAHTRVIQTM